MPEISTVHVTDIPSPDVRGIAERVFNTIRLSAVKAAAHFNSPTAFPLPASQNSLERLFLARLKELKPLNQQTAVAKTEEFMKTVRQGRSELNVVVRATNFKSRVAISDQIRAIPRRRVQKITKEDIARIPFIGGVVGRTPPPVVEIAPPTEGATVTPRVATLQLRIHRLKCIDETGGWLAEMAGADEIYLGGSSVDAKGKTAAIGKFKVGDFNDGSAKNYATPRVFASFTVEESGPWPKSYFGIFGLAEVDMGDFSGFLNKMVELIREEVTTELATAAGTTIGTTTGPWGTVIGAVVGYCVGITIEWLSAWWGDEVFKPVAVAVELASFSARWGGATTSPRYLATFTGHDGRFELTYDWKLS